MIETILMGIMAFMVGMIFTYANFQDQFDNFLTKGKN